MFRLPAALVILSVLSCLSVIDAAPRPIPVSSLQRSKSSASSKSDTTKPLLSGNSAKKSSRKSDAVVSKNRSSKHKGSKNMAGTETPLRLKNVSSPDGSSVYQIVSDNDADECAMYLVPLENHSTASDQKDQQCQRSGKLPKLFKAIKKKVTGKDKSQLEQPLLESSSQGSCDKYDMVTVNESEMNSLKKKCKKLFKLMDRPNSSTFQDSIKKNLILPLKIAGCGAAATAGVAGGAFGVVVAGIGVLIMPSIILTPHGYLLLVAGAGCVALSKKALCKSGKGIESLLAERKALKNNWKKL